MAHLFSQYSNNVNMLCIFFIFISFLCAFKFQFNVFIPLPINLYSTRFNPNSLILFSLFYMCSRPMTKLSWMLFLKKNFHIKLTLSGKKEHYTNNISIQFDKWRKKKEQKRSLPTGVERTQALPTAQQVRCVTDCATEGLLDQVTKFNT